MVSLPFIAMMIALGMSSHVPLADKNIECLEVFAKVAVSMIPILLSVKFTAYGQNLSVAFQCRQEAEVHCLAGSEQS